MSGGWAGLQNLAGGDEIIERGYNVMSSSIKTSLNIKYMARVKMLKINKTIREASFC